MQPRSRRVIGAVSFLPIYLCVSHAEVLLMASSTTYLNVYRDALAFYIVSMHCSSPVNV
jgi:hypothetical protein